jgi:hypothetical protein
MAPLFFGNHRGTCARSRSPRLEMLPCIESRFVFFPVIRTNSVGPSKVNPTIHKCSERSSPHTSRSSQSKTCVRRRCRSPGTLIVQNTRLHQTADYPPGTSATTRPYLSPHRLSESNARVPILETPQNALAPLETRRLRRGTNTRDNRVAQPRGSSPSPSDSSEVLRSTVRFPPRPPPRG